MRVRLTGYTIRASDVKSWFVEGSVDGESWMEIDRETDQDAGIASFVLSNSLECRFVRLTITDSGSYRRLYAVEFFGTLFGSLASRVSAIEAHLEMSGMKLQFRMNEDQPRKGIISYLTAKHCGNVHEKGIVTITADNARFWTPEECARLLKDVVNMPSVDGCGWTNLGQWICWDFHEMRVHLTHYTLIYRSMSSWFVEASVDGESWTEIDRHTDYDDDVDSFTLANPVECRFVRLTDTADRNPSYPLEFFGTLVQ
jgi:hypothetical protein